MIEKVVTVTMLGVFSLSFRGKRLRETLSRDTRSWQLMKYLVDSRGRTVGQEELVRVLWQSEHFGKDPYGTIRVRLRRLRENLDMIGLGDSRSGLVFYAQDKFFLNPDYTLELDIQALRGLCRRAEDRSLPTDARLEACRGALELCTGPYLERSEPAPWLESGRREATAQFRQLVLTAMDLSRETEDGALCQALSSRVLCMSPGDEELNTRLMSFFISRGYSAEAVSHYTQLARMAEARGEQAPPLTAFQHI